ncbi:glycosyltransferase family 2 protein, partial [Actinomadura bangladeshensis]|nr:glycosyltransferase family 2 protein [Actinomadura bangladeshensis]
ARADGRTRAHRSIRRFQPRRLVLRRAAEAMSEYLAAHEHDREEEDITADEPGPVRRFLARPGVLLVLALTAVAVVAERDLLTAAGRLGGGALVPAWSGGASDLWEQYLSGWHPVGLGTDAGSPPYVGV